MISSVSNAMYFRFAYLGELHERLHKTCRVISRHRLPWTSWREHIRKVFPRCRFARLGNVRVTEETESRTARPESQPCSKTYSSVRGSTPQKRLIYCSIIQIAPCPRTPCPLNLGCSFATLKCSLVDWKSTQIIMLDLRPIPYAARIANPVNAQLRRFSIPS